MVPITLGDLVDKVSHLLESLSVGGVWLKCIMSAVHATMNSPKRLDRRAF